MRLGVVTGGGVKALGVVTDSVCSKGVGCGWVWLGVVTGGGVKARGVGGGGGE